MSDPRAEHAKRLLDDPLLQEALSSIRDEAIKAWEATAARDTEAREIAWLTIKVMERFKRALNSMIDDGKIAAARTQIPLR
jgi:hypothetical protein